MIIEIARVGRGDVELEGECPASVLDIPADSDTAVESPLRYCLNAIMAGNELIVTGLLEVDMTFVCSRCGVRFTTTVREGAFSATREIVDFTAHVDLTEEAREATLLAFPTHPLCRTDCKGLCAHCGVNLNQRACKCRPDTDARWNGLDHLKLN